MRTSWPRIVLLYTVGVIAAGQLGVVPPLVPALQHDLGLSLASAGMTVSIVTLVGAALGLLAGHWCETVGHARALRLGLLVMAAAAGLCAMADGATVLLVARGVAGVGYLLVVVAGPSLMVTIAEPRHHAFTLSLWGTFVPAGLALAGLLAAGFAADGAGWRRVFTIDAAVLALALVATIAALPMARTVKPPVGERSAAAFGSSMPLAVAFFCFALLFLALAGLLPAYLVQQRGLAAADAGRIVAIATALGIPGSIAAAWLMKQGATPARLIALGLIASSAIAALSFTGVTLAIAVAGFAMAFTIGGLVPAATFASVPLVAADARAIGPINGLIAQAGSLGSLAGPPALAQWVQAFGWPTSPVLLIAVAVLGAIAAFAVRLPKPASPPP
jgi:predicted MFS family arabinose efflux permease